MSELAQVIVRGDAAPDSYEDFSAMLESSLAPVCRLRYVVCIDTACERLKTFVSQYARENGMGCYFAGSGQNPYPVIHLVVFSTLLTAKSFDTGNIRDLPRRPTLILLSPQETAHG